MSPAPYPLTIGVICSVTDPCPPRRNGSIQAVVADAISALTRAGHTVHLFASDDSAAAWRGVPNVVFHPVGTSNLRDRGMEGPCAESSERSEFMPQALHTARRAQLDVLHIHDLRAMQALADNPQLEACLPPTFATCHWDPTHPAIAPVLRAWGARPLVAISHAQQRIAPRHNWIKVVYNGLDAELFSPRSQSATVQPQWLRQVLDNRHLDHLPPLVFVARMAPEKGPDIAIRAAVCTGRPLLLAGKIDATERKFFETHVAPLLSEHDALVYYLGEVERAQVRDLFRYTGDRGGALIHPHCWDEPFGLSPAEALLCGCPVIATNRGAAAEIISDPATGTLVPYTSNRVKLAQDFALAVSDQNAPFIRTQCRNAGLRFSRDAMGHGYAALCAHLAQRPTRARVRDLETSVIAA